MTSARPIEDDKSESAELLWQAADAFNAARAALLEERQGAVAIQANKLMAQVEALANKVEASPCRSTGRRSEG